MINTELLDAYGIEEYGVIYFNEPPQEFNWPNIALGILVTGVLGGLIITFLIL